MPLIAIAVFEQMQPWATYTERRRPDCSSALVFEDAGEGRASPTAGVSTEGQWFLSWVSLNPDKDQSAAPSMVVAGKSGAKKSGLHPTVGGSRVQTDFFTPLRGRSSYRTHIWSIKGPHRGLTWKLPSRWDTRFTQYRPTRGTQGAWSTMSCSIADQRRCAAARSVI
jgi:hypothetical protein